MSGKRIKEVVAFLGVIGSLVFVGLEIRQNTKVARAEAYRAVEETMREFNFVSSADPELALLLRRVTFDGVRRDELTDTEKWQAGSMYQALVQGLQSIYWQVDEGILPPSALDSMGQFTNGFISPYMRDVWPVMKPNFPADFAAYFEERFDLAS